MSRFYASLHARSSSREELIKTLISATGEPESIEEDLNIVSLQGAQKSTHASPDQSRIFISPSINQWVSLFLERFNEADEIAESLSAANRNWIVLLWTDAHEAWGYSMFHGGERQDQFVNDLAYYDGTADEHDPGEMTGDPEGYRALLEDPNEYHDLVNLLQMARSSGMSEEEEDRKRREERVTNEFKMFREALGIPHASSDYQYIRQGDTSDLLRWDEFVHITFRTESF